MVSASELLRVVLGPVVVSAIIAIIGRWRGWSWAMPLGVGAGFLTGFALLGVPKLPPRDGTDWLFWLAIPATALGVVDATVGRRWGWFLGLAAGGVVLTIGLPLTPTAVSASTLYMTAALVGLAGLLVCLAVHLATPRIGFAASIGCLCIVLAGAAVLVLSCNLRIVGVYGIAAAAAVGPAILLAGTLDTAARAVAIVALCLLAGLLAGGHFYPEPGVPKAHFAAMLLAPASMLLGAAVPRNRRQWLRGVVAVGAVAITVAIVTVPVALEAKKAAEQLLADDPYAGYGY